MLMKKYLYLKKYYNTAMKKRLTKGTDKKLFGVCSGLAEYFNCDPTIVRIITVVLCLGYGCGLLAYLIGALLMPEKDEVKEEKETMNL